MVQKGPWRVWGGVWEMIEICKIVKIPGEICVKADKGEFIHQQVEQKNV